MIDTSPYNVLFAESFAYRHQQLRVRAGTTERMVSQAHVHTLHEIERAITLRKWDVVMVAGYFDQPNAIKVLIGKFCELPDEKRARLVIFHGTTDDQHFVRQLRNVGYIATHIPWDFMEPGKHDRKDPAFYLPSEDHIQQLLLPAAIGEEAS